MGRSIDSMIDFLLYEKGEKIKINEIEQTALVIDAQERFNFYCDKFLRGKFKLNTGDKVEYKDEIYFVISEVDENTNNYKGRIRKSNYTIKFFKDNKIKAIPVILKTTAQGIGSNQFFNLPAGQVQVMFQDTTETREIIMKYDVKFIASKTPYKVIAYDLSINGFITITSQKDSIGAEDDMTNEVVGRWVGGNSRYLIININPVINIKSGDTVTLNPSLLDQETNIVSNPKFTYSTYNSAITSISSDGIIKGLSTGECLISISSGTILKTITCGVDIVAIPLEQHTIEISGSLSIPVNTQQVYTATVTNNLPVTWSLKGSSAIGGVSGVSIVNQTGNTCTVKCTKSTKFTLVCSIQGTIVSSEIIING